MKLESALAKTRGLNHLGLAVADLDKTASFLESVLGWTETARDDSYPRNSMTDGNLRLTLWQVDNSVPPTTFDRRHNIGLHHLALEVESEEELLRLADQVAAWPGVAVEFMPEPMGTGPRKHMMFAEPGGIRLELVWMGV